MLKFNSCAADAFVGARHGYGRACHHRRGVCVSWQNMAYLMVFGY